MDNSSFHKTIYTYKEGDLKGALQREGEIILYCDSYYGLALDYVEKYEDEVLQWFEKHGINLHIHALELP